jgi:hypothetical protein
MAPGVTMTPLLLLLGCLATADLVEQDDPSGEVWHTPGSGASPCAVPPALFGLPPSQAAPLGAALVTMPPALFAVGALAASIVHPPAFVATALFPLLVVVELFAAPVVASLATGRPHWPAAAVGLGTAAGVVVGAVGGAIAGVGFYSWQRSFVVLTIMHTDGTDGGWGIPLMASAGALVGVAAGATVAAGIGGALSE